jgi:23S rRNA (pseudouridine1915-N3)-methyltransferase
LRCRVTLETPMAGVTVDVRTKANAPDTSLTTAQKTTDASGQVSLIVPDDDQVGASAVVVLLDAPGKTYSSEAFANWLGEQRVRGVREIVFLCGDADGFPGELRERAHQKLSLSAMTFSHELARAMLAEQLYRAFAILSGSPYPK